MKAIISQKETDKKIEVLQKLSDRINEFWPDAYTATVQDEELRVFYNHEVVIKMGTDFEPYDFLEGMDRIALLLVELASSFSEPSK